MPTLKPLLITPSLFAPFGDVIGQGNSSTKNLYFSAVNMIFYSMHLPNPGFSFSKITRHAHVTQILGTAEAPFWYLAVSPPSPAPTPDESQLTVFKIPRHVFIKLHRGCWHFGPCFAEPSLNFFNIENDDTNDTDHDTKPLRETYTFSVASDSKL